LGLFLFYTLRKSLQTAEALSATSKQCFEQPAASFLVFSLIFIEYYLSQNQTMKMDNRIL